jgi:hypothetical protein
LGPVAMPGSMHFRWGKRRPQSYTYSPYFPGLQYNRVLKVFLGGNFWDSRSTGYKLSSPDAEQAQHPPVDPNEHGFPDTACIAYRLSHAEYRPLFELVWGEGSFDITWPADTEAICSTPEGAAVLNGSRNALHQHLTGSSGARASDAGAMPVALGRDDRTKADNVFDHWGQALEAFEASANVSAFSSKFDAFLAGTLFPYRDLILFVTFGVIVLTLVGQGLMLPSIVRWLGLGGHAADEREREHTAEVSARVEALNVVQNRLDQLAGDGRIAPEVLGILRSRHDYRAGRLPTNASNGIETASAAADLRSKLIATEREYIHRLFRDGKITDEARRRIERELDLEEASIACKKEGGVEPPL